MISDIVLTGFLKDIFHEKYRIVETKTSDVFKPTEDYASQIPVLYWTREASNPLNRADNDTFVIIRGHLESDNEFGLYVLAENVQFLKV